MEGITKEQYIDQLKEIERLEAINDKEPKKLTKDLTLNGSRNQNNISSTASVPRRLIYHDFDFIHPEPIKPQPTVVNKFEQTARSLIKMENDEEAVVYQRSKKKKKRVPLAGGKFSEHRTSMIKGPSGVTRMLQGNDKLSLSKSSSPFRKSFKTKKNSTN